MSAKLIVLDGPVKGKTFAIDKLMVTIGRAPDADILLSHMSVSRKHAQILREPMGYKVVDTRSRYGVILNQQPIRESPLNDGDEMVIGPFHLKFAVEREGAATPSSVGDDGFEVDSAVKIGKGTPASPKSSSPEVTKKHNLRLQALLEMATALQGVRSLNELLELILEQMFVILKPDRAYILLTDPRSGEVRPASVRTRDGIAPHPDEMPISQTICNRVVRDREALITTDAAADQRFKDGVSIHGLSIRSAMCAPMIYKEKVVGLLHVDTKGVVKLFSKEDLQILVAAASTAAAAVANASLSREIREHEEARRNLSRFFSPSVVEQVTGEVGKASLGGKKMQVTVLFADIRGFTGLSQSMPVEEVVSILNRFFSISVTGLFKEGGTLDKFLGDGLMAIFGAPVPLENAAAGAVRAAMSIMAATKILNDLNAAAGIPRLNVGIGLGSGDAIVGTIGSPERLEYTAIGPPVNLASRLTAAAEPGQILIDKATAEALAGQFPLKDLGETAVKGFSGPIRFFQVSVASDVSGHEAT